MLRHVGDIAASRVLQSQTKPLSFLHNSRVYVTSYGTSADEIATSSIISSYSKVVLVPFKSWVLWVMAHFNTCISLTHLWSYYCSIFQNYISFKSNSTSFLHTLGVTIITKKTPTHFVQTPLCGIHFPFHLSSVHTEMYHQEK